MEKNNNKTGMIIGIVAVVALLGIGGFFLMQNNDNETQNQTSTTQQQEQVEQAEAAKNIVETAAANSNFSTLVAAVQAAGLAETLSGTGPFTVFAPTNAAFEKLPAGTVDTLLKPENKTQLTDILTYHVVPSKVLSSQLSNGQKITTVQGEQLTVEITDGKVYLVDAKGGKAMVTTADLETSNGVIHVIDAVLLPN